MTIDLHSALRPAVAGLVVSCAMLAAAPASAHQHNHPTVADSRAEEEGAGHGAGAGLGIMTMVATEVASYDVEGHRGEYVMTMVGAAYQALPWLHLSAHAPLAYLMPEEGEDELGLGDLMAGAEFALYHSEGGLLSVEAGLGAMFPTGDKEVGLGSGHVMIGPSLTTRLAPGHGTLFTLHVVDAFPIAGDTSHEAHEMAMEMGGVGISLITPHEPHELEARLSAAKSFGAVMAGVHGQVLVPWSNHEEDIGPVTVGGDLAWQLAEPFGLALSVDLPVSHARYYDWKAGLSAALSF